MQILPSTWINIQGWITDNSKFAIMPPILQIHKITPPTQIQFLTSKFLRRRIYRSWKTNWIDNNYKKLTIKGLIRRKITVFSRSNKMEVITRIWPETRNMIALNKCVEARTKRQKCCLQTTWLHFKTVVRIIVKIRANSNSFITMSNARQA